MSDKVIDRKAILELVKTKQITPEEGYRLIREAQKLRPGAAKAGRRSEPDQSSGRARPQGLTGGPSQEQAGGEAPSAAKSGGLAAEIAVIGMAGRFPGAADLAEFWRNLAGGVDSVGEIPQDRFDIEPYYDPDPKTPNKTYCKWSALVPDGDKFDPLFFNISPREAELMDPQQRVFLEEAWRALEDTGYAPESFADQKCGVFVGVAPGDYLENVKGRGDNLDAQWVTGSHSSFLAARISYFLNLTGPSMAIDTACSSSLVAVHQACQSIRSGESGIALAGGVYIFATPAMLIMTSKGGMLSRTGKCKAFDNDADGFVPTEGVGVVVLKPLARAVADRDHIYGVIKGSHVNQDGKTNGITAPSGKAQTRLELAVYRDFGLDPGNIGYLEAHGTGTKLGDPIEVSALTKAFREYTPQNQYCAIGSVKTNIGHGITAAGVAGLIKILLCLKHRKLVPSLHFQSANEHIDFAAGPFYVSTELTEWTSVANQPRLAAISSFGLSGTNCHMVVQEGPPPQREPGPSGIPYFIIPLAARNREALRRKREEFESWLEQESNAASIADIAYTLQTGRSHFPFRCAMVTPDIADLKRKLRTVREQGTAPDYWETPAESGAGPENPGRESGRQWLGELQGDAAQSRDAYRDRLLAVADLYVQGHDPDWARHYPVPGRRISLPGYPFERERYWITPLAPYGAVNRRVLAGEKLHPLVSRNCSTLFEQKYQNTLTGEEFFLTDHIVAGRKMLPGVAYLETIHAIGKLAALQEIGKIKDLYWLQPVVVGDDPVELEMVIDPNPDWMGFEVRTQDENGARRVHCQAKISCRNPDPQSANRTYLKLDAIMQSCATRQSGADCYTLHSRLGVSYGPGFKTIQSLMTNGREVVARLELPEALKPDSSRYYLHPALLDGALQTVIGFSDFQTMDLNSTYLPFSVAEVEIIHPLPRICYVYTTRGAARDLPDSGTRQYDIAITDEQGLVLVNLKGYAIRPLRGEDPGAAVAKPETAYFANQWERGDSAMEPETDPYGVLVLDTDATLSGLLRQRPEIAGVYLVKPGNGFARPDNATYQMDPTQLEDYQRLAEALKSDGVAFTKLIYRWTDEAGVYPEADLDRILERGPAALLYLTQAFMKHKVTDRLTLLYVYRYQNEIEPHHCAISGFAKTVRWENPQFTYKTVGFDRPHPTPWEWDTLIEPLMRELKSGDDSETEIRYANRERWVKQLREIRFSPAALNRLPLKNQGVYLITGGAGGLGLIFAAYLTQKVRGRIILTGRSELGAARKAKIEAIKATGAEVTYFKTDISDPGQVRSLVDAVKAEYGAINGIIHSAGVLRDAFILKKTKAALEAVVAPKVRGALLLDEATRDEALDFFVLFSALAAVIGNVGQADYAYANAFLDGFAASREAKRRNRQRSGKTVAINWPLWRDGGMTVDPQSLIWLKQKVGMVALEREDGIAAFEYCLQSEGFPQIAVMKGDPAALKDIGALGRTTGRPNAVAAPSGELSAAMETAGLREAAGAYLKQIFSRLLKLAPEKISSTESFERYGIDSVMIVALNLELENAFGELPKTLLFEYQNLAELTGYFIERHRSKLTAITGSAPPKMQPVKEENGPGAAWPGVPLKKNRFDLTIFRHRAAGPEPTGDLAIIGVSGEYPLAEDLEQFWENLKSGKDCIEEIPAERWDYREYFDPDKAQAGKCYTKWGGFIRDADQFDPLFFNITPKDAENMDPQARLFLKTVWRLLEDAGYTRDSLSRSTVGVFVGVMYALYQLYGVEETVKGNAMALDSSYASIANRVSYFFNFKGPSMALDTMCSSSLTSVHLACESIRRGECDLAVAGGVNLSLHPNKYLLLSQGKFPSSDGRCRSFGAGGDGYVPGEGVGAVLIKPLPAAVRDRDHIYAVIKGSWINHGGRTNGYTVPNPRSQAALISRTLERAGINPRSLSYLEAHGTGTSLGDPVEISGLEEAFREYTGDRQFCPIGSVKSNIGHLESAAGVAGITKVLLQMKYRQLVPSLHADPLNPHIHFENSPFYVQRRLEEWKRPRGDEGGRERVYPRRAGISAFGAGGANAHLILEEFDAAAAPEETAGKPRLVVLSAKNKEQLREYARKIVRFIAKNSTGPADGRGAAGLPSGLEKDICRMVAAILTVREADIGIDADLRELNFSPEHYLQLAAELREHYRIDTELSDLCGCTSLKLLAQYLRDGHPEALACIDPDLNAAEAPEYREAIRLGDFAYTLQVGREAFDERLAIVAAGWEELTDGLQRFIQGEEDAAAVYTGRVKAAGDTADDRSGATAGPDSPRTLIREGRLGQLAGLWVAGVAIDWRDLYDDPPRRIPLPTYPFGKKRYWFNSHREKGAPGLVRPGVKALPAGDGLAAAAAPPYNMAKAQAVKEYHGTEVVLEIIEDSIALITMQDHPSRNMFSERIIQGLIARFAALEQYHGIKAVVLTGSGNIFSMGGTAEQLNNIADRKNSFTDAPFLYRGLLETSIPVIAAIQGHASGGGLLFGLYADIVVMAEESVYSAVFTKYGFTPGMGATFILKEKFGNNLATEMMYTAKAFRGEELKERGASVIIKQRREVLAEAMNIARLLAQKPRHTLEVLKQELAGRILAELPAYIERETYMHGLTFSHPEVKQRIEYYFGHSRANLPTGPATAPEPYREDPGPGSPAYRETAAHRSGFAAEDVQKEIAAILEGLLRIPAAEIDAGMSFRDMGIDSINGVELIRDINKLYHLNLDAVVIYDDSTVARLAQKVVRESGGPGSYHAAQPEHYEAGALSPAIGDFFEAECGPDQAAAAPAREAIQDRITAIVTGTLHLGATELDPELSFRDMGVDSINGVEIIRDINKTYGLNLDAVIIYDRSTIPALAGEVEQQIGRKNRLKRENEPERRLIASAGVFPSQSATAGASRNRERYIASGPVPAQPQTSTALAGRESPPAAGMAPKQPPGRSRGIAIIGMSGRFPGADNLGRFWNNLQNGIDSVGEVPPERWDIQRYFDPDPRVPNKTYCRYGGFLNHSEHFDSLFFNISPLEAELMDPQQRVFLEEAWKALEDAGYAEQSLSNLRCGVFVGATQGDYLNKMSADHHYTGEAFTGVSAAILASRISYFLNLTGPSMALDTACSSSLVAVHQACRSILDQESDMALAGGVRLMFTPDLFIQNSKMGVLSPAGRCQTFDRAADGIVLGEGVGVVVLKPLEKALRDRDHIYGVILGSGLNQDGRTNGITAPSAQSQTRLELDVYRRYQIHPETIGYVEAHGTGTKLGDPIEIKALNAAFGEFTAQKQFCPVGSVKTNIGHTTMAAGVAGLIKVLLAMENRQIPPSLHYHTANEHIDFQNTPFYVNTTLREWPTRDGRPRRAAVSAFGFSGTNCHLVVEEAPPC
jgi:polyketide synthase PksL